MRQALAILAFASALTFVGTADGKAANLTLMELGHEQSPQAGGSTTAKLNCDHHAFSSRGVFDLCLQWRPNTTLHVCFFGDDRERKAAFVEAAQVWLPESPLKFDFGPGPKYYDCDVENIGEMSEVKVAFNNTGAWSAIGTESMKPEYDHGPSLNVGVEFGTPYGKIIDKPFFAFVVRHEMGHALGLKHEHQNPDAHCDHEFNWAYVKSAMLKMYGWKVEKTLKNLQTLLREPRYYVSDYDPKSIMHYSFPPEFFIKGNKSICWAEQNYELSEGDRAIVRDVYKQSLK